MVRHGESEWNKKNIFTGWYDADLSDKGEKEAEAAGRALKETGWKFDIAYVSMLTRAQKTLASILKQIDQEDLPIEKTWRLNERHYGNLTGMNKQEIADQYGEAQTHIWRRSFETPPPSIEPDNVYYSSIVDDPRYVGSLAKDEIPKSESLKLTIDRVLPFWNEQIVPQIKAGKRVLIAAHGNSLRGIVKYLEEISDADIPSLEIPTGIPFVYELDINAKPISCTFPESIQFESFSIKLYSHRNRSPVNNLFCFTESTVHVCSLRKARLYSSCVLYHLFIPKFPDPLTTLDYLTWVNCVCKFLGPAIGGFLNSLVEI
ncbi:unnamed protein product [Allacma fusca]|uniref:Phosphoglycerate mutase n=1 Tax=Allacma fusca TaxID=39272 RepID=A0A8J2JK91_9HEXA|nr:unnamed protein product [Allacma fusca]